MATSTEQIQAYLRSLGVDLGLFGNVNQNDLQYAKWGDTSGGMGDYAQYGFTPTTRDAYLAGIQDPTKTGEYRLSDGQFSTVGGNYGLMINPDGSFTRRVKVGDKESVEVPYTQQPDGSWAPNWDAAQQGSWDTNLGLKRDLRGMATVFGAALGGYGLNELGAFGAAGDVGGAAAGTGGNVAGVAEGMWPGLSTTGGNYAGLLGGAAPEVGSLSGGLGGSLGGFGNYMALAPELYSSMASIPGTEAAMGTSPYTVAGEGMKAGGAAGGGLTGGGSSVGGAASQMPSWQSLLGSGAGAVSSLLGGGSSGGSALGGLLGAGLGYLDAKSQPDSLTIKNEIDPRLAQYAYGANGTGGIAGAASNLMNQQLNGPNPLSDAGKQISGMANTLPSYNDAVANNKSLWDYNPFVQQQTKAITDNATRNMLENIFPQIGSEANSVGGYGGSRQGIAQGLGISRLNQDLAPTIAKLGSDAFENSQNRALSGAGTQLNYSLANQLQQAGLLGKGAEYQQQGSWAPIQNATNVMGALPGNSSRTEPLFNNPYAGALGGASLGSQIGGGTNWGDLLSGIGNIGNWFNNSGSGSSGGVSSGMTGMGTINWNDLFGGATLPPYRG